MEELEVKRSPDGRFLKRSPFGDRTIGVRPYREDEGTLEKLAQKLDIPITVLAREAIAEGLKSGKFAENVL